MKESRPKASTGLRIAAGFCLAAVVFAAVCAITSGAHDLLPGLPEGPAVTWLVVPAIFAVFASVYVLITGRVPNLRASPVYLDDAPVKPKWHGFGMAIVWLAVAGLVAAIVYVVYFLE